MAKRRKVALVTGGNKGIGLAVCRELARRDCSVILAGRDERRVEEAAKKLGKIGRVVGLQLDVTDTASVLMAEKYVSRAFGRLDILVNNAGVMLDRPHQKTIESIQLETIRSTHETNFYGPLRLIQAFLPMMKENNFGRIINVSSGMGQLSGSRADYVAYRTSKTALNQLTRLVALDTEDYNIACNSMCPGWVRTDMGGEEADRTPAKGAETIIWLAMQGKNGPTGGFFRDKKPLEW